MTLTHSEAIAHIDRWYRYGDRYICVTPLVFLAYYAGLDFLSRFVEKELPPPDKYGRIFLAYKTAIVYAADWRP